MLKTKQLRSLIFIPLVLFYSVILKAEDIHRKFYNVTISEGSSIDIEDSDIDLDHLTVINFPDENILIIYVVEDPTKTQISYELAKSHSLQPMENITETKSDFLKDHHGISTLSSGKIKNIKFCVESGWFTTKEHGYVLTTIFPLSQKDSFNALLKPVLSSLKCE